MAIKTAPYLCVSSSSSANQERLQRRNASNISGFAMRALPPPLIRIATNRIRIIIIHRRSHISVDGTIVAMSDEGDSKINGAGESPLNKEEENKKEEPPVKLPPPPEKPLPGDCCGNGCVPCVWDTYYEELEDYNKLVAKSKT